MTDNDDLRPPENTPGKLNDADEAWTKLDPFANYTPPEPEPPKKQRKAAYRPRPIPQWMRNWGLTSRPRTGVKANVYDTSEWRLFRKAILARDNSICQWGLAMGEAAPWCLHVATEVDHIKPAGQYPALAYEATNCVAACKPCNAKRRLKPGEFPEMVGKPLPRLF